jgi:hypothetical protein
LLDTVEILKNYKETLKTPMKINFMNDTSIKECPKSQEKSKLVSQFFDKIKQYDYILPVANNSLKTIPTLAASNVNSATYLDGQKCSSCGSGELTESSEFIGIIICVDCGHQETTMNLANSIKLTHNDSKRINICPKYSYDKKSHFQNCINQYQGKHKNGIEPHILNIIRAEIDKYNLVDHSKKTKHAKYKNVTKEHIFLFVKELKLTKCYGDINLIHHLITDHPLNDISHLVEKLLQDFDQFVQMHYKLFPDEVERKNFNYQHLLYQLLLRHKYPCAANEFNFLKTIDRKYYHDEICRIIFENLGWNYSSLF